jgi:hypothetical protein
MLTDSLKLTARLIDPLEIEGVRGNFTSRILDWGTGDTLTDALRLLDEFTPQNADITSCSPVISTAELTRIRNNVVAQFNVLRNNYSNVGGSLDSTGIAAQYEAVFDAMEGGSYCYYTSDEHLVVDIGNAARGANQVLSNAFNQFSANFANRMGPVRSNYNNLQITAANATTTVEPVINSYKALWAQNFTFHLHQGINGNLDNLMNEYSRLYTSADTLFDQGVGRVQGAFEAAVRQSNVVFGGFGKAHNHWNTIDGAVGYGMYVDNIRMYDEELSKISRFTVIDNQINRQIMAEIEGHIKDVQNQFAKFPKFIAARPSAGFALDPGTSALKFFSRQLVLNIAQGAGAHFTSQIAAGQSLIGTGFSYEHGGKMPPHAEHKDGKDCDIFSAFFKVGGAQYNEAKSIAMATWLLNAGVSRLIYTNSAVVAAANAAVPGNAVAVTGSGHETHMHFDVDSAT